MKMRNKGRAGFESGFCEGSRRTKLQETKWKFFFS